ncbi:MAG: hypothetical protein K2O31_03385 [Clostridia bacterium]|nr:hypothetical protein [Clostridia bacterium]
MKLGVKAKRNIGLVVVTLAIVVAIILVVYFVQKNDDNDRTVYGHYGEVTETSQAYLNVTDRYVCQTYEGVSAVDGKLFLIVDVEVKAKKKLALASDKFYLNAAVNVTSGYVGGEGEGWETSVVESTLKKGQCQSIRLIFEIDGNRQSDCYMNGLGANIDLCISV